MFTIIFGYLDDYRYLIVLQMAGMIIVFLLMTQYTESPMYLQNIGDYQKIREILLHILFTNFSKDQVDSRNHQHELEKRKKEMHRKFLIFKKQRIKTQEEFKSLTSEQNFKNQEDQNTLQTSPTTSDQRLLTKLIQEKEDRNTQELKQRRKQLIKNVLCFSAIQSLFFLGYKVSLIALQDIGLESIVLTSLILTGADFITNLIIVFYYDRAPRKKLSLLLHLCIAVCCGTLLVSSIFKDYTETRVFNLVMAFVNKSLMLLAMMIMILYTSKSRLWSVDVSGVVQLEKPKQVEWGHRLCGDRGVILGRVRPAVGKRVEPEPPECLELHFDHLFCYHQVLFERNRGSQTKVKVYKYGMV